MAASQLAAAGEKPVVFEKSSEVAGHIRCGEALLDQYDLLPSDPPGARARIEALKFRLNRIHTFPAGDAKIWILDKDRWLKTMASGLEGEGVEIRLGSRGQLRSLRREYDFVLDCSGCPSLSSVEYGLDLGRPGLAIQLRVEGDFSSLFGALHLFFVPGEVGFRWIFPKSEKEGNVGVGWAKRAPARKWDVLHTFASEELGEYEVTSRTTGCVPYNPIPRPKIGNLLLCGDAAGLVNPYHGGGIHNALISGKIAAEVLVEKRSESYPDLLRNALRGEFKMGAFARSMLEDTYDHHEKLLSYLEGRYHLGDLFTMETYRSLFPHIQMWRLGSRLLGWQFQAF
jgi:digeranylgeranylglycerophospholipid reductase